MISEKSPNEDKARGVLDRSFKIKSYKGIPDFSIKEIRNPQGNPMKQELFDELMDLRRLLFMYRLVHIKDPYKEIENAKRVGTGEREKLESVANELGIDYTGKTDEELRQAISKNMEKNPNNSQCSLGLYLTN